MIEDKDIRRLPTKKMIRCEVTGKLVPLEECQVIEFRIVAHKDADLNGYNPFVGNVPAKPAQSVKEEVKEVPKTTLENTMSDSTVTPEPMWEPKPPVRLDVARQAPEKRSVIPPKLAGIFKPIGSQGAAEERRNV